MVLATRGTSALLADASGKFSDDFDEFLGAGIEMAGHTQACVRNDCLTEVGECRGWCCVGIGVQFLILEFVITCG